MIWGSHSRVRRLPSITSSDKMGLRHEGKHAPQAVVLAHSLPVLGRSWGKTLLLDEPGPRPFLQIQSDHRGICVPRDAMTTKGDSVVIFSGILLTVKCVCPALVKSENCEGISIVWWWVATTPTLEKLRQ